MTCQVVWIGLVGYVYPDNSSSLVMRFSAGKNWATTEMIYKLVGNLMDIVSTVSPGDGPFK